MKSKFLRICTPAFAAGVKVKAAVDLMAN